MTEPVHRDVLGRLITLGDAVATVHCNSMLICKVSKVCNKQLRCIPIVKTNYYRDEEGYLKYGSQTVLIGGPELTAWILKNT